MAANEAELATQPELAAKATTLMRSIRDRQKELGVSAPVHIDCGGSGPRFKLAPDGTFVHVRSGRKVTFRELGRHDLINICNEASTYLRMTAQ